MDSRKPIFSTFQMKYIEDNNDISSSGEIDFKKIVDAILKLADDMIKSLSNKQPRNQKVSGLYYCVKMLTLL